MTEHHGGTQKNTPATIRLKTKLVGIVVVASVVVIVLVKKNNNLAQDLQLLSDKYDVLKDSYLTLSDGYLNLSGMVIDTVWTSVPKEVLETIDIG